MEGKTKNKLAYFLAIASSVVCTMAFMFLGRGKFDIVAVLAIAALVGIGAICYRLTRSATNSALANFLSLSGTLAVISFAISLFFGDTGVQVVFLILLPIELMIGAATSAPILLGGLIAKLFDRFVRNRKYEKCTAAPDTAEEADSTENDENEIAPQEPKGFWYSKKLTWLYVSFIIIIMLVYAFVFLYNADTAFDNDTHGGYFSPSWTVLGYTAGLTVLFACLAAFLKVVFFNAKTSVLLLCALFIPFAQYYTSMYLFEGPLAATIKEGGALYFIANHDFNLDGYNDEWYKREHTVRTVKCSNSNDEYIVRVEAQGKGDRLEQVYVGGMYNDKREIEFSGGWRATILSAKIEIEFENAADAKNAKIYRIDRKKYEPVETVEYADGKLWIILDEATCKSVHDDPMPKDTYYEDKFFVKFKVVLPDEAQNTEK